MLNKLSIIYQTILWVFGIAWHNTIKDECTQDFNCCAHFIGQRPAKFRFPQKGSTLHKNHPKHEKK